VQLDALLTIHASARLVQVVTQPHDATIEDQLVRAARDLWSAVLESGEGYVVFMDHRRLPTRVERTNADTYRVSWQADEDGPWITYEREFQNLREAAFHGFQGPH
jgi:hypothetical protein